MLLHLAYSCVTVRQGLSQPHPRSRCEGRQPGRACLCEILEIPPPQVSLLDSDVLTRFAGLPRQRLCHPRKEPRELSYLVSTEMERQAYQQNVRQSCELPSNERQLLCATQN